MGRPPAGLKKGPWTPEEDILLVSYVQENGAGNWRAVPTKTGLMRCSKSCRLRWTNYLRPGIKRGNFSDQEERLIIHLQALLGNRWAAIASYLPERTDNDIKNYWNTHLKKKLHKQNSEEREGQIGNFHNDNSSPTSSAQSRPPTSNKGQWERRLQTDMQTAKRALSEALSLQKPDTAFEESPSNQTRPYVLNAGNVARLLENWATSKPKLARPKPDHGLYSTSPVPTPPTTGSGSRSGSERSDETGEERGPLFLLEKWLFEDMAYDDVF